MTSAKKVVLITGCSNGGIGYALADEYANQGCKVYATARKLESMATFQHPNIEKLTLDVLSDEQVTSVVKTIIENEGQIDVLVNNAGVNCAGAIADVPIETFKSTFDANFFSVIRMFQAVFPYMASRKSGVIVNVGSVVGNTPTPWNGVYSSSKAALHRVTEVLYQECQAFNIHVTLVVPGAVKSNIADTQIKAGIVMPENSLYKSYADAIIKRVMLSQGSNAMTAEEMAKLVVTKTLSKSPPQYMTMGGSSFAFSIFLWLPRAFVLNLLWKRFRGKA
ncbi:oxidoreductase [Irpex rosettiformis]|uniref:Oxidoreductase n=1 Tax=Irpex rosettiformis TaxID=378272 RepID=A0ACB8UL70_9APHY|nr:oxidoreductase [Irpex rosettiformis]